jgi:hypothetical protein
VGERGLEVGNRLCRRRRGDAHPPGGALPLGLGSVRILPMSRVINPNAPGKSRSYHVRTLAEMLRRLASKGQVDRETRDMLSAMVYILREIDAGVDISAEAWEKRDYWLKADRFRREWEWTAKVAAQLEAMIRQEAWDQLPAVMIELHRHLAGVKIAKMTRKPEMWAGAYDQLIAQSAEA